MLNHIIIMGRLTRDPELRRTQSGTAVARFTVAVDRDVKGQNGERETDFIDCVAWSQRGEFVSKYFQKGSMIIVAGRLQVRDWTDKEGGKRRSAEINVDNTWFGESRRDRDGGSQGSYQNYGGAQSAPSYGGPQTPPYAGGYNPPSQGGFQSYGEPAGNDFAELSEDDGDLPF
ncbi:MAG: single-stranded DNA-binding protein [Oscillospiraceae bacterium]|nr:single-stranded DNA-binding protein [Oscillospiraceae bacterium]